MNVLKEENIELNQKEKSQTTIIKKIIGNKIFLILTGFAFSGFIYTGIKEESKKTTEDFTKDTGYYRCQDNKWFLVDYVDKETIYPGFGYSATGTIKIRKDLSKRVKRFVRSHEIYHQTDKSNFGGNFGSEVRANIIPGFKDSFGFIATVYATITDKDRILYYVDRFKKGK